MKLLTQELRKQFPKLYETGEIETNEKVVIAKFFTPWGSWTWYATEFDGEDLFFGLVDGLEKEWGYFSLKELEAITGPAGLKIERDLYFGQPKIKDIPGLAQKEEKTEGLLVRCNKAGKRCRKDCYHYEGHLPREDCDTEEHICPIINEPYICKAETGG